MRSSTIAMFAVAALGCGPGPRPPVPERGPGASSADPGGSPRITHGAAAGDVTAGGAVIWARADREAVMHVALTPADGPPRRASATVRASDDFTGSIAVAELAPDTPYRYAVWFTAVDAPAAEPPEDAATGEFRTAPAADAARPVRLVWSGDLAGQNACRDAARGYPIFAHITARSPDVFIALGDMIYADRTCEATGLFGNAQVPGGFPKSTRIEHFWAHWKYNREDPGYRALLAAAPVVAVWDDHEALDDFGPSRDSSDQPPYTGEHLMPLALQAFLDYNPIRTGAGQKLYRGIRWGAHLELFVLDTRRYRDSNAAPDTGERPKTLLGAEQRAWLEQSLAASTATWKLIVTSVPLSIPTGDDPGPVIMGRDGSANYDQDTGYERELLDILRFMQKAGIERSLWITTDIHFATGFRHRPLPDAPTFEVYEFAVGPLHAGLFPSRNVDDTLHPERLFFHGPDDPDALGSLDDALPWMSFGQLAIDAGGALSLEIVNGLGQPVYQLALAARGR